MTKSKEQKLREKKLREYVRDLRGDPEEASFVPQGDVAEALGVSQGHYSDLESGAKRFRLEHLVKLARFHRKALKTFVDLYDVQDHESVLADALGVE